METSLTELEDCCNTDVVPTAQSRWYNTSSLVNKLGNDICRSLHISTLMHISYLDMYT